MSDHTQLLSTYTVKGSEKTKSFKTKILHRPKSKQLAIAPTREWDTTKGGEQGATQQPRVRQRSPDVPGAARASGESDASSLSCFAARARSPRYLLALGRSGAEKSRGSSGAVVRARKRQSLIGRLGLDGMSAVSRGCSGPRC